MKRALRVAAATACVTLAFTWLVHAQILTGGSGGSSGPSSGLQLSLSLAFLNAVPPPADDPLLDASGNMVMDSSGKPMSNPDEKFHQVKPIDFDPAHSYFVEAAWLDGIGCPTPKQIQVFDATGTQLMTTTYPGDPACTPGSDPNDAHNEGLVLSKVGPTANNAAAIAELKKVNGITLTELGYDIRKPVSTFDPRGSHCGAGAPRFNVVTSDGTTHFIGCNSPPGTPERVGDGWIRLRWGVASFAAAFPPFAMTDLISRIFIVFDEGQDAGGGPDTFGAAILDNIDVNGTLVGRGPTN